MREISLHILDTVQNSITAGASFIQIYVTENERTDLLSFTVSDNGKGMSGEMVKKAHDPFVTERKTRKVGLGIPLTKQACEMSGGSFLISSRQGEGTVVKAVFGYSSIDRRPLGDMANTMYQLIISNDKIDFLYRHAVNAKEFIADTREIRKILNGISVKEREISAWLLEFLKDGENLLR